MLQTEEGENKVAICLPNIFPWTTMGYRWRDGVDAYGAIATSFPGGNHNPKRWNAFTRLTIDFELIMLISLTNVHYWVENCIPDIKNIPWLFQLEPVLRIIIHRMNRKGVIFMYICTGDYPIIYLYETSVDGQSGTLYWWVRHLTIKSSDTPRKCLLSISSSSRTGIHDELCSSYRATVRDYSLNYQRACILSFLFTFFSSQFFFFFMCHTRLCTMPRF